MCMTVKSSDPGAVGNVTCTRQTDSVRTSCRTVDTSECLSGHREHLHVCVGCGPGYKECAHAMLIM